MFTRLKICPCWVCRCLASPFVRYNEHLIMFLTCWPLQHRMIDRKPHQAWPSLCSLGVAAHVGTLWLCNVFQSVATPTSCNGKEKEIWGILSQVAAWGRNNILAQQVQLWTWHLSTSFAGWKLPRGNRPLFFMGFDAPETHRKNHASSSFTRLG